MEEGEPPSLLETATTGEAGRGPQNPAPSSSSSIDKGATPSRPPSLLPGSGSLRRGHGRPSSSYTTTDNTGRRRLSSSSSSLLGGSSGAALQLEGIRGLSDEDIAFLKAKLAVQPNSDMVRGKDFEAFSLWCVRFGVAYGWVVWDLFGLWRVFSLSRRSVGRSISTGPKVTQHPHLKHPPPTKKRWSPLAAALRLLAPLWCHHPHPHEAAAAATTTPPPLLHGFASRRDAEALLEGSPPGTFLVRCSTSHLGLLAISFVVAGGGGGGEEGKTLVQHCLVRVTPQGCDLFVETGRKRYEAFQVRVFFGGGWDCLCQCGGGGD